MTANLYGQPETVTAEASKNLIKACLFNLVVLCNKIERLPYVEEEIRIITEKYPCRVIFVKIDSASTADFLRTTTALQAVGSGSARVLCEVVTIEISNQHLPKVPFLILPHIMPDLPLYILLGHNPSTDGILSHIQKYAMRVLFDENTFSNYSEFAEQILKLLDANSGPDIIDINWAHTRAWRDALAQVFDTQASIDELTASETIQISYVASPESTQNNVRAELQAVMLQAWLASKLNWTVIAVEKEAKNSRISYKRDHTSLSVSLVPKDSAILPIGSIFSIEIMTHNNFHYLMTHENDPKIVRVHASNSERCEMPYSIFLPNFQNGPALVSELFHQLPSDHYKGTLKKLSDPLWSRL